MVESGKHTDTPPEQFFCDNDQWFRMIGHLVGALLSLPAGEARVESVFSGTGLDVTKLRSSLSPIRIGQLAVVRDYIHARHFQFNDVLDWIGAALRADK